MNSVHYSLSFHHFAWFTARCCCCFRSLCCKTNWLNPQTFINAWEVFSMSHLYYTIKVLLKFPKFLTLSTTLLCSSILTFAGSLNSRLMQIWEGLWQVCDYHRSSRRLKSLHYLFTSTKRESGVAGGFCMFLYPSSEDVALLWLLVSCHQSTLESGDVVDTHPVVMCFSKETQGFDSNFYFIFFFFSERRKKDREQFYM